MKHNNVLCFLKLDLKIKPESLVSHSSLPPGHRMQVSRGMTRQEGKHQLEEPEKTANILWSHHWLFPQNDRWGMSTEIQYWWGVTTKNWVVFLMVKSKFPRCMTNHKHYPDLGIVIRGDWLWKAANINDKNNSAAVYVGSTLKVHNPLFSVGKLLRNKLMQRFYWSIQSKW